MPDNKWRNSSLISHWQTFPLVSQVDEKKRVNIVIIQKEKRKNYKSAKSAWIKIIKSSSDKPRPEQNIIHKRIALASYN